MIVRRDVCVSHLGQVFWGNFVNLIALKFLSLVTASWKKSIVPSQVNPSRRLSSRSSSGIDRPCVLCSPLRWSEEVGTSIWCYSLVPKVKVWSTDSEDMVAVVTLHGRRIRFSRLPVHLIGGDFARNVDEAGNLLVVAPMKWWILYPLRVLWVLCLYKSIQ
jgi:hypothetical protein